MEIVVNLDKKYFILFTGIILILGVIGVGMAVDTSGAYHNAEQIGWSGFVFPADIKAQLKGDVGNAGGVGPRGDIGPVGSGPLKIDDCSWTESDFTCSYTVTCPAGEYLRGIGPIRGGHCPTNILCCKSI